MDPFTTIPEYEGSRRCWIHIGVRYDSNEAALERFAWRFQSINDTVRIYEPGWPTRTMLDANGDGHRDFYDSLLVLGSDTGWVADTATRYIVNQGLDRRVVDLDADGYDDLVEGRRVYWGDSVEPLRHYSSILNPEGTHSNQVAPAAICVVNRLQGIPAIATFYDVDFNQGDPLDRWRNYAGWRLNQDDVSNHSDTLQVDSNLWRGTFMSHRYAPDPPTLVRNGCWLRLDYNAWVAFDSSGVRSEDYSREVDTLVLSGQQLAGSTMLPLSHPPTLDSMLHLTISQGSVLSVRQWLTPEQIIPSETMAYYLQPQTINSTSTRELIVWPDVTGDSIPELGVYRAPWRGCLSDTLDDYCIEIYDIAGAQVSSAIIPSPSHDSSGIDVVHGRIVWKSATLADISVRVYDAAGRLLLQSTVPADTASTEGIRIDPQVGKGLRLIELTDAAGRTCRTTMFVR